jgi:hypothetical protein
MNAASRRTYLALGRTFVAIGALVALFSLLDRAFTWGFFRGSPVGTAAFLVVVGALLLWTVRQDDRLAERAPATVTEPEFDDVDEETRP